MVLTAIARLALLAAAHGAAVPAAPAEVPAPAAAAEPAAVSGAVPAASAAPVVGSSDSASMAAFEEFVRDGTGDLAIQTAFGHSLSAGCACHFEAGATTGDHTSALAAATDTGDGSQLCYSSYPGNEALFGAQEGEKCISANFMSLTQSPEDTTRDFNGADAALITQCLTPDREMETLPKSTVFLLGDSHAGALHAGLVHAVRGLYQVRRFRTDTVGTIPHRFGSTEVNPEQSRLFYDLYNFTLKTLNDVMLPGDVVVLMNSAVNWMPDAVPTTKNAAGEIVDRTGMTVAQVVEEDILKGVVQPRGGKLVLFGDWGYWDAAGFSNKNPPQGDDSAGVASVSVQAQAQVQMESIADLHNDITYMSLMPLFCTPGTELEDTTTTVAAGTCGWNIPGTQISAYADAKHLSTAGSIYMWPYLCDAMPDLRMHLAKARAHKAHAVSARSLQPGK